VNGEKRLCITTPSRRYHPIATMMDSAVRKVA